MAPDYDAGPELDKMNAAANFTETNVAEIVHDLKNPLSAIALEAGLLDERIARGDRRGAARAAVRIARNVAYMDRMVLDLMDTCSLAHGRLTLHRTQADLRALLIGVIDRIVPDRDRDRVVLDAEQEIAIAIDAFRIERVVANLIDNALRYTPGSCVIVVRLTHERERACVSVIDAGPGIPLHQHATLFEKYTRAETSSGRCGSGLGLYVSKRIIEAHDGVIGIDCAGVGSRFFFELPAR